MSRRGDQLGMQITFRLTDNTTTAMVLAGNCRTTDSLSAVGTVCVDMDNCSGSVLTLLMVLIEKGGVDPGCGGGPAGSVSLGAPAYCSTPYPSGLPARYCRHWHQSRS